MEANRLLSERLLAAGYISIPRRPLFGEVRQAGTRVVEVGANFPTDDRRLGACRHHRTMYEIDLDRAPGERRTEGIEEAGSDLRMNLPEFLRETQAAVRFRRCETARCMRSWFSRHRDGPHVGHRHDVRACRIATSRARSATLTCASAATRYPGGGRPARFVHEPLCQRRVSTPVPDADRPRQPSSNVCASYRVVPEGKMAPKLGPYIDAIARRDSPNHL